MKRWSEASDDQKSYLEKLGEKINSSMKNLNKSNAYMSARIGCSNPHIIDLRKGRTIATVLEIVSICDTLAITPNELLDVDDSNKYADDKFLKSNKLNIELMQMMLDKLEHMNDAEKMRFRNYIDMFE
ncbi:hypothetical protein [Eubacterium ramulus]|jgi:DNA-binding Xre family transcriptional regulator